MRFVVFALALLTPTFVVASEPSQGMHDALSDCAYAMSKGVGEFPKAAEVEGAADTGFVVWYNDANGKAIYGTRLATQDGVTICSGPNPMGPHWDNYLTYDAPLVQAKSTELGMVRLNVPVAGEYYANCAAEKPDMLLAVAADETQRVGFKLIFSPNVGESCKKFAP